MASNWETLKQLRDELSLQAHLFEKEAQELWHSITTKIRALEKKLEAGLLKDSQALGEAEKHFFVGSDEEINQLVEDLKTLQKSSKQAKE
jgi:hypothetical protein